MTPKTRRKHAAKPKVTHAQVAEAIGHAMRYRLARMTDAELGRFVLLLTTGRA